MSRFTLTVSYESCNIITLFEAKLCSIQKITSVSRTNEHLTECIKKIERIAKKKRTKQIRVFIPTSKRLQSVLSSLKYDSIPFPSNPDMTVYRKMLR